MNIKLTPVFGLNKTNASVEGDIITINENVYDFSKLRNGDTLPDGAISGGDIFGDVSRIDGDICLTIKFTHGVNAPYSSRFTKYTDTPMKVTVGDVSFPEY